MTGDSRKRLPDPAAARRNKATRSRSECGRLGPSAAARGSQDNPGDTYGTPPKVPSVGLQVAGGWGSPAPATAPLPAALPMTSAGTASAAPGTAALAPAGAAPACLAAPAPPRPRPTRRAGAGLGSGRGSRRVPEPRLRGCRQNPTECPGGWGRSRSTARTPAATSPGAQQPKPGAPGPGGTVASSDKSSRKKLKAEGCSPPQQLLPEMRKLAHF